MSRPITKTYNAATTGTISGNTITGGFPILMNYNNTSVGIGFACIVTGTVNYTVYHTYDNAGDPSIVPAWLPHGTSNMIAATTTQESNFVLPIAALQIIINSGATGTDNVRLSLCEQGVI